MGRKFDIEYDDFTGGYYVAQNEVQQPTNTWTGNDLAVSVKTGRLIPLPIGEIGPVVKAGALSVMSRPYLASSGLLHYWDNTTTDYWYEDFAQTTFGSDVEASVTQRADPVEFNGYVLRSTDLAGNANVVGTPVSGGVSVAGSTTAIRTTGFTVLGTYKYWAVGNYTTTNPNRMYYSSPNSHTTAWSSANYYDIGAASNTITGYVDMLDALYVLTTGGVYVVTGVLGATATIRQLNRYPVRGGASFDATLLALTSNVSSSLYDGPLVLSGQTARRILQGAADANKIVQVGPAVLVGCTDGTTMVNDPSTSRAWYRRSNLNAGQVVPGAVNRTEYFYTFTTPAGGSKFARYRLNPKTAETDPSVTTFQSRTATLADHVARDQFRVRSVTAEVVIGDASASTRSVGVQIGSLSVPVDYGTNTPTQFSAATSTAQVYSFTANSPGSLMATTFPTNDAGPTLAAAPIVTLQGVELRRLVMHCEEV